MAHENRIHQLEDIANKVPHNEGKYQDLIAGEMSTSSSQNGTTHLVPVPVTLKAQLGSPVQTQKCIVSLNTDIVQIDCVGYWSLFDDFDDIGTVFDGMARSDDYQRLHRQLFLCRRFELINLVCTPNVH